MVRPEPVRLKYITISKLLLLPADGYYHPTVICYLVIATRRLPSVSVDVAIYNCKYLICLSSLAIVKGVEANVVVTLTPSPGALYLATTHLVLESG